MLVPAGGRPGSGSRIDVPGELGVDQGEATSITFDASILDNHLLNFDFLMFSPTGIKRAAQDVPFPQQNLPGGHLPGDSARFQLVPVILWVQTLGSVAVVGSSADRSPPHPLLRDAERRNR